MKLTRDHEGDWKDEDNEYVAMTNNDNNPDSPNIVTLCETKIGCATPAEAQILRDQIAKLIDPSIAEPAKAEPSILCAATYADPLAAAIQAVNAIPVVNVRLYEFTALVKLLMKPNS